MKKKIAELEAKDRDIGWLYQYSSITLLISCIETLKKQALQQASEYNRLATKYNEETGSVSDKRKD